MAKRERSLVPGVVLILIGVYFLLRELNLIHLRWRELYPVVLLALGLLFLVAAFRREDKGAAFPGTVLLVLGIFFALRNYDLAPISYYLYDVGDYWPVFLLAFGLGFVVQFFFARHDWGLLIPGGVLLFLGVMFLFRNLGLFYWWHFADLWPVILILIGLAMVISGLRKRTE